MLWVVIRNAQADLLVDLKSTIFREQHDGGGLERVLGGQIDATVVYPTLEVTVWWPVDGEMPLEYIVLGGVSVVAVLAFVFLHHLPLTHDALDASIL